jgi:hypothetical protein
MRLKKVGWCDVGQILLAQDREHLCALANMIMSHCVT